MLIDTHCHLYKEYYGDIDNIIKLSKENNVMDYINNGCDAKSNIEVLKSVEKYPSVYGALGIHPEYFENYTLDDIKFIEDNLSNPKIVAIGEIGLDYHYSKENKDEQIKLLELQLELAEKYDIPVIIHSREATEDTINTLKKYNVKGVIHSFSGSLETARIYIKMGYLLGINGVITFKNCNLKDTLKEIPIENIVLEDDDTVKKFVGEYKPKHYLLNDKEPIAVGPLDLQSYLFEHKRQQAEAMKNAKQVIIDVANEFEKLTGRKYGLIEEYKLEDADIAIVCMNSTAGTAKHTADIMRNRGIKAGVLKIRVFRPFPSIEIANALKNIKAVAILDKADSLNAVGGPLFTDITSALYVNKINISAVNYIYGIGGRDTTQDDIEKVYNDLQKIVETGNIENPYRYLGVRGDDK